MKRLEGKTAIITGSARGIGKTFAKAYINEGAFVVIADIDYDKALITAKELGSKAFAVKLDVTNQESIDKAIKTVEDEIGQIDILINNAALFDLAPITEITKNSYDKLFAVNVSGTLFLVSLGHKL